MQAHALALVILVVPLALGSCAGASASGAGARGREAVAFSVSAETGAYAFEDRPGGVTWRSGAAKARFGQATLRVDGRPRAVDLGRCEVEPPAADRPAWRLTFRPVAEKPDLWVRVDVLPDRGGRAFTLSWEAADPEAVESIRLLDDALWATDAEEGCLVVPVREGLLIPATSGRAFTHGFDTYAYEGCHMEMVGAVKGGAAALVTWDDPYVLAEVRSRIAEVPGTPGRQVLGLSLVLRKSARSCRVRFLGRGDYVAIAKAYREVAREKGYLVPWDEKLRGHPDRAKYFGAVNFKLWSALDRQMNEDSTKEERVTVHWTFPEAAEIAEHLRNDLGLDRVLFILGGWIHRGYDNQHPDVLPAAPECGGDEALADCARRVRALGYLFCLHDNYQDMYKDAPSWDERYLMRGPDGSIARGGRWAGGRAYLTCSKRALELARRPQNLPAVRKLTGADSYFIDTTYAAGLCECFAKDHPLTRADDMHWKQALSDYAREVFGSFGSECGREWAVPHADFFEGLTGVSGTYYHDKGLLGKLGAVPVPLFEMVYRDCIAMYGKYGYDIHRSAEYVLDHVSIGRPLNYHSVPAHLYWKEPAGGGGHLGVRPEAADVKAAAPRQFEITYRWAVAETPKEDWAVFVHFTDASGKILFQNDHNPKPPTSAWKPGTAVDGPFGVTMPGGLEGTFDIRVGFYRRPSLGRATLDAEDDGEGRCLVGRVRIAGDDVDFQPVAPKAAGAAGRADLFVRADGGWAEGMHPMDRFVKNTYEVLSPLNELTSRVPMTRHEFLSADRTVRRTTFGEGADAVTVTVNLGSEPYRTQGKRAGDAVLPPYGFLVDGPTFLAYCATSCGGVEYPGPALFTLRSLDGRPLGESKRVRVYHGFGDLRVRVCGAERRVAREEVVTPK